MENNKHPNIRFAEFNSEWRTEKFANVVNRVSKQSNASDLPKIEFEDIISGEGRLNKDISNKLDNRKGIKFEPHFILYGKLRPYLKNWLLPEFKGVALGDFWVFEPKDSSSAFIYYLIQTDKYQTVANLSSGTKMPRSDWKTVSETEFQIPFIEEQNKIGDFFKYLDDTINLHQQELDTLKQTKQGFLQKMFPKEGETVPEVRFQGFSDDWNKLKLGEIMQVTSVKRIHQSDWTNQGVRFLRARDIVAMFKNENPSEMLYISKDKYDQYSKASGKVVQGDLLVTGVGSIGVPMLVKDDNPIYFKDGNIIWFKNQNTLDGQFLYYSFINSEIQKFIKDVAGIGTVGTYTIDSGKKTPISVPNREEQLKIGEFFKKLDETIELQEQELVVLKETKKAFLQKMFV